MIIRAASFAVALAACYACGALADAAEAKTFEEMFWAACTCLFGTTALMCWMFLMGDLFDGHPND